MGSDVQKSAQLFTDVLPWLALLAAMVIVGGVLVLYVRRMMTSKMSAQNVGFTLDDLRSMRAKGELSEEEFQRARERMIAHLRTDKAEESGASQPIKGESKPNNRQTGPTGET